MKTEDISRLTRKGYLQCPACLFDVPAGKFSDCRSCWYGTLGGQRAILGAACREACEPFSALMFKTLDCMVKIDKFIRRFHEDV